MAEFITEAFFLAFGLILIFYNEWLVMRSGDYYSRYASFGEKESTVIFERFLCVLTGAAISIISVYAIYYSNR